METLFSDLIHVLVEALVPILLAGVGAIVKLLYDKLKLEHRGLTRDFMVAQMQSLVLAYEEKIEAAVKAGLLPVADKSEAKLAGVMAGFLNQFPNVSDEEADILAHQAIATVGVGSADFLAKLLAATNSKAEAQ